MKALTLSDMQQWASDRGGKCLSREYWDRDTELIWRCEKGHTFDIKPLFVQQGAWCPQCTLYDKKAAALELMQEWAEKRGGKCLSKVYTHSTTFLEWECANGHRFKRTRNSVKQQKQNWCIECKKIEFRSIKLEEMKKMAEKKHGKCLSKTYIDDSTKLDFKCEVGHKWKARPLDIKHNNSWCPYCYGKVRHTINYMRELAERKGGKCLSEKYKNCYTPLKWECDKGHVWSSKPANINAGHWCPQCFGTKKHTIDYMRELAERKRGKCLSEKYKNNVTPLMWECSKGHVWSSRPINITRGHWCMQCYRIKRKKIQ